MKIIALPYLLFIMMNFIFLQGQEEYRFPLKKEFSLPLDFHLFIQNEIGTIELRSHPTQNLIVEAEKVVKVSSRISKKEAEEYAKTIKIDILQQGKEIKILTKFLQKSARGLMGQAVEYKIFVPKNVGKFSIHSKVGKVRINDIEGTVDIEAEVGDVSVEQVQKSRLRIKARSMNVKLFDIEETINNIDVEAGNVSCKQLNGEINVRMRAGSVELTDIEGPIDIEVGSGNLSLKRIKKGKLRIKIGTGIVKPIDVEVPVHVEEGGNVIIQGGNFIIHRVQKEKR